MDKGSWVIPALLINRSILPNFLRASSASRSTSSLTETSILTARPFLPIHPISVITSWADSRLISPMTISAPSRAKALAMDSPIPIPPPVTTATFPATNILAPLARFFPTLLPHGKCLFQQCSRRYRLGTKSCTRPPEPEFSLTKFPFPNALQAQFNQTMKRPRNISATSSEGILGSISSD